MRYYSYDVVLTDVPGEICLAFSVAGCNLGCKGCFWQSIQDAPTEELSDQLFAAKMEYHLDYLGQEEVLIVAESPNGFKRWMIEYELESRPETWHELGGVPTYVLTKALREKHKAAKCTGRRPVSEELMKTTENPKLPSTYAQIPGYKREG